MIDPIPEGYISLGEVRTFYLHALWNGEMPVGELRHPDRFNAMPKSIAQEHWRRLMQVADQEWRGLLSAFLDSTVEALIGHGKESNVRILPSAWEEVSFPEKVFQTSRIPAGVGPTWDSRIAARTPFVRRDQFESWLDGFRDASSPLADHKNRLHELLRQFLLGLAQDGIETPDTLEDMARRWGMRPFAGKPAPDRFNPLEKSDWTLPMVLAWLAWRSPEAVRRNWDAYRSECLNWQGYNTRRPVDEGKTWWEINGYELVSPERASATELSLAEACDESTGETALMSIKSARETLWNNLAAGKLTANATDTTGNIVSIPQREWAYLELAGTIDGPDHLINRAHSLNPAYENLTFARGEVMRLWRPLKQGKSEHDTETFEYPHTERFWPLFAACIWVSAEGAPLTTARLPDMAFDHVGASKLFAALNDERLQATGMNRELIREIIPATYWEMASLDSTPPCHFVNLHDESAGEFWGTMTPAGSDEPRWTRINIEASALKKAFPFARSKPDSCRKWLESEMRDSPAKRPTTKAEYLATAQERFNVIPAEFERAWAQALENVPEAKAFWTRGGRPKKGAKKPS